MIPDVTSIANPGGKCHTERGCGQSPGNVHGSHVEIHGRQRRCGRRPVREQRSSDIYRGMFTQQLAATMTKQMKSPLEGQIDKALNKSSAAHGGQHGDTEENGLARFAGPGVISSPQGWRRDPINGETPIPRRNRYRSSGRDSDPGRGRRTCDRKRVRTAATEIRLSFRPKMAVRCCTHTTNRILSRQVIGFLAATKSQK